jgi:hypothetical protein
MSNVIWFNTKRISDEQAAEIRRNHGDDTLVIDSTGLARLRCDTDKDLRTITGELCGLVWATGAVAVYGFFGAPLLGALYQWEVEAKQSGHPVIPCFAIWGYGSTDTNGKPKWNHKQFCRIGGGVWRRP